MKYKWEIIETSSGIFTLIGYTWEDPYIWKINVTKVFSSIEEVTNFLIKNYKLKWKF